MHKSILWKGSILSVILLSFAISLAFSQGRTITGTVSSADGESLPGVAILLEGTTVATMTDLDGNYSILVPGPEAVLVFSYVGFVTQNIIVGDQTTINLEMGIDVASLGEVVVTGYGTQRKKEITSAITRVNSDEFNVGYVYNPAQLIQGKVAGLSITKPGGDPNEEYNIRLRGLSTIGANTQPLVVIDGVLGGSIENVDPSDIESINVLKDGSAAAIYGTRGSSGVIIVTTKKGRKGTAYVEYNGLATLETVAKYPDMMNADEWRAMSEETGLGTDFGENTNWFKECTQTAFTQVHNLSMSGGSEKTTYRASFNFRDGDGIILNTGYSQLNGRLNLRQKALKDRLTIDLNMGATQKNAQYGFREAFRYATVYNPTAPVRSDAPAFDIYDGYFQQILFDYYNPVQILEQDINDGKDKLFNIALKGELKIIEGLYVDAFYSVSSENRLRGLYYDKNSYWTGRSRNGLAERNIETDANQLFESTAHWTGNIGPANLTVLGGYSYQEFEYEGFSAIGGDFINDAFKYNNLEAALDFSNGIGEIESYKNSAKLIAFFGRVNLNVTENWFLTASARYEGSSRFGANNQWGLFPAIGGGVELANFLDVSAINNLKLRASYGVTGNMPDESYLSLLRLGPGGNFFYNGEFVPGYAPVSNANEDLKWEKKGELDIGIDFAILQSKLVGSFDFYTRTTTDLLFEYEVPVPPNLFTESWVNIGEIKNSGLELDVTWNAVKTGDFSYSLTFTPTYYLENTLVSLSGTYNGEELEYGVRDLTEMGSPGQTDVPLVRAEEGKPIGQLWTLVFKEIDEDGNLIFEDRNEDGTVDANDRTVVGNGLPDAEFGLANFFKYKNFDLSIFFRSVLGHDLLNSYRGFYEVPNMIGSYNLPKTAKDMRNKTTGTLMNSSMGILSSYHIENASFIALDNISLGYNFNLHKDWPISNFRVYLAGNNLFYITGYKGADPNPRYGDIEDENNPLKPGIDRRNTWFRTRSVSLGVTLGF